jgi:formylglycine-generating enzyme required for sulfatase activity
MPLNLTTALVGMSVAALVASGAATLGDRPSAPDQLFLAQSDLVTLPPATFDHPLPGEFLRQNHAVGAPVVRAALQQPVDIMKYQVSASEYGRCVRAGACKPAGDDGDGNVPVTGVSHIDAEAYARWLSAETGAAWRLPTDIEWAYAAAERFRGDIEGGEADPDNPALRWLVQYRAEASLRREPDPRPRIRGGFGADSRGVADIAGNVWEWTSTCYVHVTQSGDGLSVASTTENCGVHVVEGFHRTYMSNFIRDGKSGGCAVGTPPDNLGFRLVRERLTIVQSAFRWLRRG